MHKIIDRRPPPDLSEDLSKLTVHALKDRLRDKKLKVSGVKQVIDRLTAYYRSVPDGCERPIPAHVTFKQPDGTRQPIRIHNLKEVVKMFGFYYFLDAKRVSTSRRWQRKESTGLTR